MRRRTVVPWTPFVIRVTCLRASLRAAGVTLCFPSFICFCICIRLITNSVAQTRTLDSSNAESLHSSLPSMVARSMVARYLPSLVVDGVLLKKTLCAPHVFSVPPYLDSPRCVRSTCAGADPRREGTDGKHSGCARACTMVSACGSVCPSVSAHDVWARWVEGTC